MEIEFSRHIFEKFISNLMKTLPVGAELFHAERRINEQADGQT
jgi:hypothetical protein